MKKASKLRMPRLLGQCVESLQDCKMVASSLENGTWSTPATEDEVRYYTHHSRPRKDIIVNEGGVGDDGALLSWAKERYAYVFYICG